MLMFSDINVLNECANKSETNHHAVGLTESQALLPLANCSSIAVGAVTKPNVNV